MDVPFVLSIVAGGVIRVRLVYSYKIYGLMVCVRFMIINLSA